MTATGAEVAARVAAALAARADPDRAPAMARYMRDQFPFLGVMAAGQKDAWREVAATLPRRLPEPVVVEAATDLWARPEREHQYLACTLVNRHAGRPARSPDASPAMARYMRDQFPFLGVMSAGQKDAWREVAATLPSRLPEPVVVEAATDLWARPEREHQYLACTLVNRHAGRPARSPDASPAFLDAVEHLLTTRPWWDTVDALATHAVGDLVRHHPELRADMDRWLAGDDLWLVRSALLHMNRWRAATDAAWLFAACLAQAGHRDVFVRKAIGWALREYSKVDAAAVVAFVADHEDELSGLSRREALMWLARRGLTPPTSSPGVAGARDGRASLGIARGRRRLVHGRPRTGDRRRR